MTSLARGLVSAAATAVGSQGARHVLRAAPPGGDERWTRTNHRGEPVSLVAGPATTLGLVAGAVVSSASCRQMLAGGLATAAAGVLGLVDDLAEDATTRTKGLRGHLGALARGTITTGGLKVIGIGAASLASAALLSGGHEGTGRRRVGRTLDSLISGALIAGSANLVNLLDLRPGRARKAVLLAALPLTATAGAGAAVCVMAAAAAGLPDDLAERDMLGDSGANALGALLGVAAVTGASRPVRTVLLGLVVGLTLASERVSFTAVIERTSGLRALDRWGRRPPATTAGDEPSQDRAS